LKEQGYKLKRNCRHKRKISWGFNTYFPSLLPLCRITKPGKAKKKGYWSGNKEKAKMDLLSWWHLNEKSNALDYLEMSVRSLKEVERTHYAWKWVCIALHGAIYSFGVCAIKGTNDSSVLEDTVAFTWEEIPGDDDEKLKKFLVKKYDVELENAKIEKYDNDNIIKVSTEKNIILLEYVYKEFEKYKDDRYAVTVKINGKGKKPLITDYRYSDGKLRILDKPPRLISFDKVIQRCKNGESINSGIKRLVLDKNQEYAYKFLKDEIRNRFMHYVPCSWSIEIHGLPQIVASCFEIVESLAGESGNLRWKDDEIARIKALCNSGKELALSTKIHRDILER
jgi:hypothetical protein